MKYPNLRYGNPLELQHYAQGIKTKELAKRLRRSERSVKDWLEGKKEIPFWVPELLRLQHMEYCQRAYQMNMQPVRKKLGLVYADNVIKFQNKSLITGCDHPSENQTHAELLQHG
jgi:hypothetical protein